MQPTAVITGASAGIGRELAKALASQGWRIIGTGRNAGRIVSATAEIEAASTTGHVEMIEADLSLLASAAMLADRIGSLTDRVDLLVNNAGGLANRRQVTSEGLEASFVGNHLGPFLLTLRLLPLLRATAKSAPKGTVRILNTSSMASEMIDAINLDDIQGLGDFQQLRAYSTSKLANVMFARSLAERLDDDGIVAHAVHPGAVASNFYADASAETQAIIKTYDLITSEEGADTLLWLATAPEGALRNGLYWASREVRAPHPTVEDRDVREQLWAESERLIAQTLAL